MSSWIDGGHAVTLVVGVAGTYGAIWISRLTGTQKREEQFETFRQEVMKDVRAEHARCESSLDEANKKIAHLEARDSRAFVIETAVFLAIEELQKLAPTNPCLIQLGIMLRHAFKVERELPDRFEKFIAQLERDNQPEGD